ncbi:MAG TPA: DUF4349 domain-containing protein [Solirubrobacterales bacterium]|nr:DUF4349 domain-containing protein [Solirubrobacterales bacterium]
MERSREYEDLAVALAEVRPAPREDFAAELDQLVAAGFPRKTRLGRLRAIVVRFHGLSLQRRLVASGAAALTAIAIATVVVSNTGSDPAPIAFEQHATKQSSEPGGVQYSEALPQVAGSAMESSAANGSAGALQESAEALKGYSTSPSTSLLSRATHRDIERSAEIGLLADPADVADDSAKVFSAVHDARGIVLRSTTTAGRNAGAHFDLLIPSARLGDALAAFSAIDEVRTRHEATTDITKPTVATGEELQDSRARIDSLLAQLSTAEIESERDAIEAELRGERRRAARLRSQVARLHQRADFSRVSLRIETGTSATSAGGAWGVDDALGDAGRILGIAAGVTVIGLAILSPLALLGLLAWLAYRLWLRTRRERALDA